MTIAVNTKYFLKACQLDYSNFIYESFSRITKQQPQHTFIFFSDTPFDPSFNFSDNSIPIVIKSKVNALLPGIFYRIKIAGLLKKHKANIFVNADGICSLFTKVPQCFIAYQLNSLSDKIFIKKNDLFLYKKFTFLFFKRAKAIVTGSQFSKNNIIDQFKIDEQKIDVIYNGVSELFVPIDWEEKEKIKVRYADGNEYFIFIGDDSLQDNLLNLLKAFSQFKKWQKSSMQLLIVTKNTLSKELVETLRLFKYRKDVKLLSNLSQNELTKITATAYSMIYFPLYESLELSLLQTMSYNVPVITSNTGATPEICADAALYTNLDNPKDLSEKLMLIFKGEDLRRELIEKGRKQIQNLSFNKTSELLWKSIVKSSH